MRLAASQTSPKPPRPIGRIYSPQHDRFADFADVTSCVERARLFWSQAGAADRFTHLSPDDYSRFQKAQQEVYLEWLGKVTAAPEPSSVSLLGCGAAAIAMYVWSRRG